MKTIRAPKMTDGERRAREESGLLLNALNDVINGRVTATERSQTETVPMGAFYRFRLTRPTAPDGGMILMTFTAPGQKPYTTVALADNILSPSGISTFPRECWAALEKIRIARQVAIDIDMAKWRGAP